MLTRGEQFRALLFATILLLLFSGLVYRLYSIQVKDHAHYRAVALKQHRRTSNLKPWRGDIYFRERSRRVQVVGSVSRHSLMIHGRQKNPEALVTGLGEILRLDAQERNLLRRRLGQARSFWYRRRGVSHTEAAAIKKALRSLVKTRVPGKKRARYVPKLQGLDVVEESIRLYPFGSLGAHVLGLVNIEGKGQSGIESSFNEQLEGLSGLEEFEIDNRRRQLDNVNTVSVPALPGYSLVLTLDRRIQSFLEKALDEAWDHWSPEGISVVAVDPSTGRIIAMACRPGYDPNNLAGATSKKMTNRILTSPYEPGSTIKAILTSRVWEAGKGHPERAITLPRTLRVKKRRKPIVDSHKVRVKGRETREKDAIIQSSNVGSYLLSSRLTDDEFRTALRLFGLGQKTGIPLGGESRGNLLLTRDLHSGHRAAVAQGYGIMVTPLQMVLAYAAIANGGTLYKPRLAYELVDHEGKVARRFEPRPVARVLSQQSANWMKAALADVVQSRHGTARRCRIKGYTMGGKTGTSKKLVKDGDNPRKWHYSPSRTVCSFIGFAPVDQPRIAIAVMVDDPTLKHGRVFGGNVAAPIASKVIENTLKYYGIAPKEEDPKGKSSR